MSFPIPSFFKIRLVAIILCFFILFGITGFVRWCFADNCFVLLRHNDFSIIYATYPASWVVVDVINIDTGYAVAVAGVNTDTVTNPYHGTFYLYSYSDISQTWSQIQTLSYDISPDLYARLPKINTAEEYASIVCGPPPLDCETRTQQFIDSCPSRMGTYDCETDTGTCTDATCSELENIVRNNLCTGQEYSFSCNEDVEGKVETWAYECRNCTVLAEAWADANCNGIENVDYWDCGTNEGTCKDYNCNDLLAQCYDKCNNLVDNFSCSDSTGSTVVSMPCECIAATPEIQNGTTGNEPPPGLAPNTTIPESAETDPNAKIAAHNTQILVDINGKELPEISKTIKANGAKTDQTNDSLKSIDEKLGSIDKKIEAGKYIKETISNDYSVSESLNKTSQFTSRLGSFIADLKATPLFALPNQILFNIPNSTESIYTVEMGQYGQAEIDLSNYAAPLLVLRAAFLLCFSYAGLRIVVSKK